MEDKDLSDFLPDISTSYFKEFEISNSNITVSKEKVIEAIKKVKDPEVPVNLYDLGLIYKIEIDPQNNISIDMTLTNPNCPVAGTMPESVGVAVERIPNLSSIKVGLVWYPKWDKNMMSEDAKLALDIF